MTDEERKKLEDEQRAAAAKAATQTPATPALPATPAATAAPVVDVEQIRAEALRAGQESERARVAGIRDFGAMSGVDQAVVDKAIADGLTEDQFRAEQTKAWRERTKPLGGNVNPATVSVGPDKNVESLREAIPDALAIRSGVLPRNGTLRVQRGFEKVENKYAVHERALNIAHLPFTQLIRLHLESQGIRTVNLSNDEVVRKAGRGERSFVGNTTGDFSTLLENALNKIALIRYQNAPSSWREFTRTMQANDLRVHNLYSHGGMDSFARVGESGQIKAATKPDGKKETVTPRTFARTYSITDEAIINDDMGVLQGLGSELGESAEYTIQEWAYYSFIGVGANGTGPTMNEDGGILFNNTARTTAGGHANYVASSGAAPSKTQFDTMMYAFATVKGLNGKVLNLRPDLIIVPANIEGTTRAFLASERWVSTDTPLTPELNPYSGSVRMIVEPLLDVGASLEIEDGSTVSFTGDTTAWFGVHTSRMPALVCAFYGAETPQIISERPIGYLGTVYQGHLRFGFGVPNWRPWYKNEGA